MVEAQAQIDQTRAQLQYAQGQIDNGYAQLEAARDVYKRQGKNQKSIVSELY